jgi:hypothetical protein
MTLTVNIREGTGVNLRIWMNEKKEGRWPSWAPTRKRRPDVNRIPFTPPNVDSATNTGTAQDSSPNILLPKVWN